MWVAGMCTNRSGYGYGFTYPPPTKQVQKQKWLRYTKFQSQNWLYLSHFYTKKYVLGDSQYCRRGRWCLNGNHKQFNEMADDEFNNFELSDDDLKKAQFPTLPPIVRATCKLRGDGL